MIELRNVHKSFGSTKIINGVSLEIRADASPFRSLSETELCEAQPELVPPAFRIVWLMPESV